MSSHCVSICLLVLLGAVMTSGVPLRFISEKLKHDHDVAAKALKLAEVDVITEPLFSSVIRNSSCQRRDDVQLMSAALDVYTHIFSSILGHQQTENATLLAQVSDPSKVKEALQNLQQKMEELKGNLSQMNQERKEVLTKLKNIKVQDVMVQKKALAQFKAVYQAASLIGHCGHTTLTDHQLHL